MIRFTVGLALLVLAGVAFGQSDPPPSVTPQDIANLIYAAVAAVAAAAVTVTIFRVGRRVADEL